MWLAAEKKESRGRLNVGWMFMGDGKHRKITSKILLGYHLVKDWTWIEYILIWYLISSGLFFFFRAYTHVCTIACNLNSQSNWNTSSQSTAPPPPNPAFPSVIHQWRGLWIMPGAFRMTSPSNDMSASTWDFMVDFMEKKRITVFIELTVTRIITDSVSWNANTATTFTHV